MCGDVERNLINDHWLFSLFLAVEIASMVAKIKIVVMVSQDGVISGCMKYGSVVE
jgi:hypothetical protein